MTLLKKTLFGAVCGVFLFAASPSTVKAEDGLTKDDVVKILEQHIDDNPEIIMEALNNYQARERQREEEAASAALKEHKDFLANYEGSPFIGPKDAEMVVVEFFDYNCGYCKRALPDIVKLQEEFPDVKIVFKEFPILSPESDLAARMALAADKQGKYFEFHSALMTAQGRVNEDRMKDIASGLGLDVDQMIKDKDSAAITKIIEDTKTKGSAIGVRGTPAFVIGDKLVRGAVGFDQIKAEMEKQKK